MTQLFFESYEYDPLDILRKHNKFQTPVLENENLF